MADLQSDGFEVSKIDVKDGKFYKGVHLNLSMSGVHVEIQLHTENSWALKKKGDAFYEKWRSKEGDGENVDLKKLSPKEKARYIAERTEAEKNGEAYLAEPLFVNLRSSASGIALDSQTLSNDTGFAGLTQSPSTNSSNVLRSMTLPSGNLATSRSIDNTTNEIISGAKKDSNADKVAKANEASGPDPRADAERAAALGKRTLHVTVAKAEAPFAGYDASAPIGERYKALASADRLQGIYKYYPKVGDTELSANGDEILVRITLKEMKDESKNRIYVVADKEKQGAKRPVLFVLRCQNGD